MVVAGVVVEAFEVVELALLGKSFLLGVDIVV